MPLSCLSAQQCEARLLSNRCGIICPINVAYILYVNGMSGTRPFYRQSGMVGAPYMQQRPSCVLNHPYRLCSMETHLAVSVPMCPFHFKTRMPSPPSALSLVPAENPPNHILLLTGLPEQTTDQMLYQLFGQVAGLREVSPLITCRHEQ